MPTHTYECRVCVREKELHRVLSACRDCREKYGIRDFEPTPPQRAGALVEVVLVLGATAAFVFFIVKWAANL